MKAKLVNHRGKEWIQLDFAYDSDIIRKLKTLKGTIWSKTLKAWLTEPTAKNKAELRKIFGLPEKKVNHFEQVERFKKYLEANRYSSNTVKSYTEALRIFLAHFSDKEPTQITNEDTLQFFHVYAHGNNLSVSWQRLMINSIKLYFATIEDRKLNLDKLVNPRKDRKLPNVLSKEEVQCILKSQENLKHRAMLSLIYCCGLRRSELLALKPQHIDSKRNVLLIKMAKGRKDRMAPLPKKMIEQLREYYKIYQPKVWLFEGQVPPKPLEQLSTFFKFLQTCYQSGFALSGTFGKFQFCTRNVSQMFHNVKNNASQWLNS